MGRECSTHGKTSAYRILLGKLEGKRPLGRPSLMWWDNKMDLRELGCYGLAWIKLAKDRDQ
jgi:hypothetical protein